jgi:hypothetical protein
MVGGCFTDLAVHGSNYYHEKRTTELRRISTDAAAASGAIVFFLWRVQSAQVVISGICALELRKF